MNARPLIRIPHVRRAAEGRPRFDPGPNLRALGWTRSHDLKHPDGRWFTIEEAMAFSAAIKAEAATRASARAAGKRLARLPQQGSRLGRTLGELAEAVFALPEFKGERIVTGKRVRKGLAPKTVTGYRKCAAAVEKACTRMAEARAAESLWDAPAAAFTPKLMNSLIDAIEVHSGLHQARACRAFLSQLWSRLAGEEPGADPLLFRRIEQLPVPEGRVRPWTVEELAVMVRTADNLSQHAPGCPDRPELGDMMILGAMTVLRQNDRLQLTAVQDIGTHWLVATSKGRRSGKRVKLLKTPVLAARLAAAHERRKAHTVQWPHLVIDEQEQRPFHPEGDHYRKLFATVRKAAAKILPACAGITDQDLRDTAQTWLYRQGVDEKIIARLAAHSAQTAAAMQERHYIERDGTEADAGLLALNRLIEGKI